MKRNSLKNYSLGLCAAFALSLMGCGGKDSGDKDDPGEEVKENALALINGLSLMGTWQSTCHSTKLFDKSVTTQYEFKGDDVARRYIVYADKDCKGEKLAKIEYSGEFAIKKVKDKKDHRNLNLKYKIVKAKLNSETAVSFFNTINFCGFTDWRTKDTINLTKESRRKDCPLPDAPGNDFELVKIEKKKLYFGNPGLSFATKEGDRPKKVDVNRPYTKQ